MKPRAARYRPSHISWIAEPPVPCDRTTSGYFGAAPDNAADGATWPPFSIGAPTLSVSFAFASAGYQIAVRIGRGPVPDQFLRSSSTYGRVTMPTFHSAVDAPGSARA